MDNRTELDVRLRAALEQAAVDLHEHRVTSTVREMLIDACRVARAGEIPPEMVIVAMKQHWTAIYDMPHENRAEVRDGLERLVTACVEAYFGSGSRTES